MSLRPAAVKAWTRTHQGKKLVRYSMVSIIAVAISQVLLVFTFGVLHWSARMSNIFAVCVSAVPSYVLNRAWVWGKRGRSHLMKEVVPFWGMALLGLVLSTFSADFAEEHADSITSSHFGTTVIVSAAALAAFGVLWIGKFIILNKVLFASHPEDLPPALDGRTGLPT